MNHTFNVPVPPSQPRALSIGSSQMIPTSVTALLAAHQPRKPRSESTGTPPVATSTNVPIAGCAESPPKSAAKQGQWSPFHGVASMPLLQDSTRPLVPFYATPPRLGSQFVLKRQHSSGPAIYGKSGMKANDMNGRYFTTPPPRSVVHKGSDEEVPAVFAASKFSDSPSAKNLPPPPSQWLDDIERSMAEKQAKLKELTGKKKTAAGMDGIEEEETTSDDTGVVFDLDDVSPSSFDNDAITAFNCQPSSAQDSASSGVRVDPMKLIAALTVNDA